jgi:hypothetical protein
MLIRYISRLRQAPKSVRDRHAFFIATGFTVVVGLLWAVTLPLTLEKSPVAEGGEESTRPLASFFSRAREQVAGVIGSFKEQAGVVSSSTESNNPEGSTPYVQTITLTPEELAAARASATIPYIPPATTTPRVIRIATTSAAMATTTASTTR